MQPPVAPAPASAPTADPSQFGNYSNWAQQEMAKGFTPEQLHQTLAQSGVTDVNPTSSVAPKPSGNWLTHLLPTIGGIGGTILGGLATAGLGGEVAGGAGGSALGKAIENALEGKKVIQGNDVTAGLEGGIGTGIGGIAGKGIGLVGNALGKRAGNLVADAATKSGVANDLANTKIINAIYGGSKNDVGRAAELAGKSGLDMTNPQALNDAGKQLLEHAGQVQDTIVGTNKIPISGIIDENGVKKGASIDDLIHSALTNTNPVTGEKLGASRSIVLGGLGPGQTDEDLLRNGYTRFLGSSAKSGADTAATDYLKEANQLLSSVNHGNFADAHDLLDAQRLVGDKAQAMAQAAAKPSADEVTQAKAAVWNDLNHKLQDMIFNHPEISDAAKTMTGTHSAESFGGNQALADLFNSRVTGAQNGRDINALMHDAYNLRDVGADGLDTVNNPASTGTLALSKLAAAGTDEAGMPTTGDVVAKGVQNAHHGPLGMLTAMGSHAAHSPKLLGTLSRLADVANKGVTVGGKQLPGAAALTGTVLGNVPSLAADAVPLSGQNNNDTMGTTMPTNPNSINSILNTYMGLGLTDPYLLGETTPVVQQFAPLAQHNGMISAQLSGMPSLYANAGGAQGLGGILSHISGLIPGTPAHTYEAQQAAIANQLGINPNILPSLMQNANTSGISQSILAGLQHQLGY